MYIVLYLSQKISDKNVWACVWSMSFGKGVKFWNWGQMLKSSFTYFVYSLIEKKDKMFRNFDNEITQYFLNLESAPKCVSQYIKKKETTKIIRYSTPISTFKALSKWNDPHIRSQPFPPEIKVLNQWK